MEHIMDKPVHSPSVRFDETSFLGVDNISSPMSHQQNTTMDTQINRSAAAFTPILTPKGDRSGSMVPALLSPSRTITEALANLASSTGDQLEEVWDEVGYSPEDRAAQLSELLLQFRDICEEKIAEERGVAETFRQTIIESREEIERTAVALKISVDAEILRENASQTLSERLATVEATLQELREKAATAKQDLKDNLEYLEECHAVLGLELDPTWLDVENDLTAERRDQFHRKTLEMKQEISSRSTAVIRLVRDCQQLMSDLVLDPETEGTALDRRIAGSLVRSKDGSFIMASKTRSDSCVGISAKAVEELTEKVAALHREKRTRKEQLEDMGGSIALLWEKLHIPEEEQVAFTESVQGLGRDTIEKGRNELRRLQDLKTQMLGKLLNEARDYITELWDQINAPQDYREAFEAFHLGAESFDDELLDQHEAYAAVLESRLEQMKPILRMIERRETIIRERIEYEELQKDPERLKGRGAALTRQLMEEEKMARRIKKELPRLTETLQDTLHEWKRKNGEDFLHGGDRYLDVMDQQEEEWNQYKADEHQRKVKKKQEEKSLAENKFSSAPAFSRHQNKKKRGPFADAQGAANIKMVHEGKKKTNRLDIGHPTSVLHGA